VHKGQLKCPGRGGKKSEQPEVPVRQGNPPEGPCGGKGLPENTEPQEGKMAGIPSSETISTKRERIATLAREAPKRAFTSLSHHIDIDWLREAYRLTRKNGAPGVDGQTASDYEKHLEENLQSLLDRAKSGTYCAPPVRRVHIPKENGETRPIGIPAFEDKVLQRAVVMVLECIYEQDFLSCSYGFRPGRSAHQALKVFRDQMMAMGGGWVIEIDIRKFFDTLIHGLLRDFLSQRVRDGVLTRLIGKWLNAGVMEDGVVSYPESGSPQGGVVSPLLANVYLHEVLDTWFEAEVRPRLKGQAHLVRYADDAVIGFSLEEDARRVMDVLPKRFGKYGLTLHPEKTRMVPFRPPRRTERDRARGGSGPPQPGSFDLLGFTHYWAKSRRGHWVIKQRTAKGRLARALKHVAEWCRQARHRPIREQHRDLSRKLTGHYGYYGITGNWVALDRFRFEVTKVWRKWLERRSQRKRSWNYFNQLMEHFALPAAVAVHSTLRGAANP
jgi:group II intron reverse transcriptase/maturase